MKAINILFLAPHWRVTLVQAFRNAVEELSCPGKLLGADSNRYSSALQILDPVHIIPHFTSPNCLKEILAFCRHETVHAIIPLTNKAVEFLDTHRTDFYKIHIQLLLNDKTIIETCHDKLKLAQFFQKAGIPTPETFLAGSPKNNIPFPLFAKQRRGEGGTNSMVLENKRDLEFCCKKFPNHVIQRYIQGIEYSIDWFSGGERNPVVITPRERLAVRGGEVMVSRIRLNQKVIAAARDTGSCLGLLGPCTLQGILDESGQFYFTDINLRFGSGSVHSISAGANIPLLIYKKLAGESFPLGINSVKDGMVMTRFSDSFILDGTKLVE